MKAMTRRGRPETWLMALLLLVTVILLSTPSVLIQLGGLDGRGQEAAYLGISCMYGLLTGAGFPLGVHLAQAELGEAAPTGGVSEAADSLGGAAGGGYRRCIWRGSHVFVADSHHVRPDGASGRRA